MHLMDAYLAGVCLMGVHLVGVQLIGRVSRRRIMHLTSVHFIIMCVSLAYIPLGMRLRVT
jgi:hypothetical protein